MLDVVPGFFRPESGDAPVCLQACPVRKEWDFEKITLTESKSSAIPQKNSTNKVNFIDFKLNLTNEGHE